MGGSTEKCCLSSVERYDIEKNSWTKKCSLNESRTGHCAIAMQDGIYVMGGNNGTEYLSSVERYNEDSDEWEKMPSMNIERGFASAVGSPCGRYIYVLGGQGEEERPLNSIERFSLIDFTWEIVGKMKSRRSGHCSLLIS